MTPEKEAYINHLMACRLCVAPRETYCATGWGAKLASDAVYIAGLPTLAERQHAMAVMRSALPKEKMDELEAKVRQYYEVRHG